MRYRGFDSHTMIHPETLIGHPPQDRRWKEGDPCYAPKIDPTARIEAWVKIDSGLNRHTRIGARTWLLCQTHVGHDCWVGADVEIATGTVLSGYTVIGDGTKVGINVSFGPGCYIGDGCRIGSGAVIRKGVYVGDGVTVGAGAVVLRNVADGVFVAGNPAQPIPRRASVR